MDIHGEHYPRSSVGITGSEMRHRQASGQKQAHSGATPTFQGFGGNVTHDVSGAVGSNFGAPNPGIVKTPSRKWYDPQWTGLSLVLPRTRNLKNQWRRWFYEFDPIIGGVIDLHSELPHSPANLTGIKDKVILDFYNEAVDACDLWGTLPPITREYLKIGEAFPYARWDNTKGYFSNIILQNQDYIEIDQSLFADEEDQYYLVADPQLRVLVENNDPQYRDFKRRLPIEFVRAIVYGEKLPLPFDPYDQFFALLRRNSPVDVRGTAIIDRLFRHLVYEDKLVDAQVAIADNFIYPLRIIKIGNDDFVPNAGQLDAFQEVLAQKQFDPNFYILTHHAINYESHNLSSDLMSLGNEYERIDKLKFMGLGVSQGFMMGDSTYASAHVGWQTALSRYKNMRNMLEHQFIREIFITIAERNEFYEPSPRELAGQYRVANREKKLILPNLDWHKKLTIREDESYLSFLSGLMGKLSISNKTFFSALGYNYEEELDNIQDEKELQSKFTLFDKPGTGIAVEGEGEDEEGGGLFSSFFKKRGKKFADKKESSDNAHDDVPKDEFLHRLAVRIAKLDKERDAESIYRELKEADALPVLEEEARFLVGEKRDKSLYELYNSTLKDKTTVTDYSKEEYENEDEMIEANYALNYARDFPETIKALLKEIEIEANSEMVKKSNLIRCLKDLVDESVVFARLQINNKEAAVDSGFIMDFLKNDILNELERFDEDLSSHRTDIKKLALVSVVLGMSLHYSTEKIDTVRVSSVDGGDIWENISKIYESGLDSVAKYVSSGIIPILYPMVMADVDLLRKFNYITTTKFKKFAVANCPNHFIDSLLSYIKIFSGYIDNPVKSIEFGHNMENSSHFTEAMRKKYDIFKGDEVPMIIMQNERMKYGSSHYFTNENVLYANYDLFQAFSSNFQLLSFILPVDMDKFVAESKMADAVVAEFSINKVKIEELLLEGTLLKSANPEYPYKVGGNKFSQYKLVNYYDFHGKPLISNKKEFITNVFQTFFDKKYILNSKLLTLIENGK